MEYLTLLNENENNIDGFEGLKREERVQLKGGDITTLPIGNTLVRQIREYIVKYRGLNKEDELLL